jgi:hypothetical protein
MTPTVTYILAAVVGVCLLAGLAFFVVVVAGGAFYLKRKRGKQKATFYGVRPAPPEDLIDAETVQTLIETHNEATAAARKEAALATIRAILPEPEEEFVD